MITNVVISLLITALATVEGSPHASGDGRRALGPLQIHAKVIQDVNRVYGRHFTHADALQTTKAARICRLYLEHFGGEAKLGRQPTPADLARIWNGGPNGWRKPATIAYAQRVQNVYRNLLRAAGHRDAWAGASTPATPTGYQSPHVALQAQDPLAHGATAGLPAKPGA